MRTPELKATILKMAGKGEFYGYEMHKMLGQNNIKIGIGRLYSVLAEMNDEGLLKDRWEKSESGPKRRVYQIGKDGLKEREKILMDAIRTVHEFYTEYLINLPPEHSVFNSIGEVLTKNLSDTPNIGYLATKFSGPVRKIIDQLRKRVPNGKIYAITQEAKELDLGIEGIFVTEGTFEDLPMKDEFLDLLVVTGNLKSDCLRDCLSEWSRVLTKKGILSIVVPTATITTYDDPLGIGDFIEQREHPRPDMEESLNSEILREEMSNHFEKTKLVNVVHITILIGLKPISRTN